MQHAPPTTLNHRLKPRGQRVPTINSNRLPIEVRVRDTKQDRLRHIGVLAGPLSRDLALELVLRQLRLLIRPRLPGRHLRREDTRRNGVDTDLDLVVRELVGQHARQVDGAGLGGVVLRVVLHRLHFPRDGARVDDCAAVAARKCDG